MKKFYILTPTYNDWKSLNKLIKKIDKNVENIKGIFKILIINDGSNHKPVFNFKKLKKIKQLEVINLNSNQGSQKAIGIGLNYLKKKKEKSIITIIDSDGEDDPLKIPNLIKLAEEKPNHIITANRLLRTENLLLKMLNHVRLIFTFCMTGKYINFGNFSSFSSSKLKKILSNTNTYTAYSGGILKNCKNIFSYYVPKKKRYFGVSKVSLLFLIIHSLNIISIFKKEVFLRSFILSSLCFLLQKNLYLSYMITFIFFILNLLIFLRNKSLTYSANSIKIKNIQKFDF